MRIFNKNGKLYSDREISSRNYLLTSLPNPIQLSTQCPVILVKDESDIIPPSNPPMTLLSYAREQQLQSLEWPLGPAGWNTLYFSDFIPYTSPPSAPASLASLLIFSHTRHTSYLRPGHRLSPCPEFSSPVIHLAPSLTSFRALFKCHLLKILSLPPSLKGQLRPSCVLPGLLL